MFSGLDIIAYFGGFWFTLTLILCPIVNYFIHSEIFAKELGHHMFYRLPGNPGYC